MPTTHFNAFADRNEIEQIISHEDGDKHPYNGKLLERTSSGFKESQILDYNSYMTAGSLDKTLETIRTLSSFRTFQSLFPFLTTYTFIVKFIY